MKNTIKLLFVCFASALMAMSCPIDENVMFLFVNNSDERVDCILMSLNDDFYRSVRNVEPGERIFVTDAFQSKEEMMSVCRSIRVRVGLAGSGIDDYLWEKDYDQEAMEACGWTVVYPRRSNSGACSTSPAVLWSSSQPSLVDTWEP